MFLCKKARKSTKRYAKTQNKRTKTCAFRIIVVSLHQKKKQKQLNPKTRKGTKIMKYSKSEIQSMVENKYYELYKYTDSTKRIHTDTVESLDQDIDKLPYDENGEVDVDIQDMDKEEYSRSILANSCVAWDDMFEDDDKVLVIVVREWRSYDVVFQSDDSSNSKSFDSSFDYCKDYIRMYNGTNESYFEDYKGGTVQIVCNETEEVVYEEEVK